MTPSLKPRSNPNSGKKENKPQAYYCPNLDLTMKVESVSTIDYVIHFPDGAERIKRGELSKLYVHKGDWEKFSKC